MQNKNFELLLSDLEYFDNLNEDIFFEGEIFPNSVPYNKYKDRIVMSAKTSNIDAIIGREELLSLVAFVKKEDLKDICLISITEPFQKKANKECDVDIISKKDFFKNDSFFDILQIEFTDLRKSDKVFDNDTESKIIRFSEEIKEKIYDFAKKNKEQGKRFVINCDAGISRSSAIAIMIELDVFKNKENARLISNHFRYSPNPMVLEFLNK
jgi:predicted protein tyrosine phosphatase